MGTKISALTALDGPVEDVEIVIAISGVNRKITLGDIITGFQRIDGQIVNVSVPVGAAETGQLDIPLGPWRDYSATLSKVRHFCYPSGSVTFNIEERAASTPATAGTDIFSTNIVSSSSPANQTSFSNAGIASEANLHLVIESGDVTGATDLVLAFYGVRS